jgi:uncharacterized membrane protein
MNNTEKEEKIARMKAEMKLIANILKVIQVVVLIIIIFVAYYMGIFQSSMKIQLAFTGGLALGFLAVFCAYKYAEKIALAQIRELENS